MTSSALTAAFRDSPAAPPRGVHVLNSALNLGQCSVGILTFHHDKTVENCAKFVPDGKDAPMAIFMHREPS